MFKLVPDAAFYGRIGGLLAWQDDPEGMRARARSGNVVTMKKFGDPRLWSARMILAKRKKRALREGKETGDT